MRNDTLLQTAIMSANCIIWGMRSQFKNHMDRLNNAIVEMESRGMDNDLNMITMDSTQKMILEESGYRIV